MKKCYFHWSKLQFDAGVVEILKWYLVLIEYYKTCATNQSRVNVTKISKEQKNE